MESGIERIAAIRLFRLSGAKHADRGRQPLHTVPEHAMKFATFMHEVDTLRTLPGSSKDLFFPEIHDLDGS